MGDRQSTGGIRHNLYDLATRKLRRNALESIPTLLKERKSDELGITVALFGQMDSLFIDSMSSSHYITLTGTRKRLQDDRDSAFRGRDTG